MFVSTFELLLNASQLPREIENVSAATLRKLFGKISRDILQGYFLTVSNLEDREVTLKIIFNVVSSHKEDKFTDAVVSSFFDADGVNKELKFKSPTPKSRVITLTLKPHDTGLLLVQPDPRKLLEPLEKSEIEIRGYVEVKQSQANDESNGIRVLLTPEHRGTFYNLDVPLKSDGSVDRHAKPELSENQQLDQIAYSLPIAAGGSLFELE